VQRVGNADCVWRPLQNLTLNCSRAAIAAVAETIAECGGMFTHHAFQEMWERVKNDKLATRELCYQLERGELEFVPARSRAWGCARGLTRNHGKPCRYLQRR
jgi:hypothetical protein